MDSYHFDLERMSKLDLHPLSLPVSRLSPAKSSSSIDQFTHHLSKGDSAYSSFSGGSTVPEYPSPFLLDELQLQSLDYNDLKHVKAKYSTNSLDPDSKSMDHIYRSMELIDQPQWSSNSFIQDPRDHTDPLPQPPPPPARRNSFVTTRNLENSRARQSPEGQHANISNSTQVSSILDCGHAVLQHKDQLKHDPVHLDSQKLTEMGNQSGLHTCPQDLLHQSWGSQSETLHKRLHSTSTGHVSTSTGHKGQFYFITGVRVHPSDPRLDEDLDMETSGEWSYTAQCRRQSCPSGGTGKLFYQEEHHTSIENNVLQLHDNKEGFIQEQSFESEKEDHRRESGRHHSSTHPVFYCGPEEKLDWKMMDSDLIKEEDICHPEGNEQIRGLSRSPLDIPRDKISKETTPLLYRLTEASRFSFANKGKDDGTVSGNCEKTKEEQTNTCFYQCGTLDDSYRKYYKEKLKDVQSKVLRETSFKRRDLQLCRPNGFKQQTDKLISVIHATTPPQPKTNIPTTQKPQETDQQNITDAAERVPLQESKKIHNVAQPQVPRIGSRKRLSADQKKLSHSEPEKLHQLTDEPAHLSCHSLGNESEAPLSESDHGLVSAWLKIFETRGRAMSTSNISKSSLKHLQHKALVAYMERKIGQKVAEPQNPVSQESRCRNSTADRTSHGSSKKIYRPLSAGQILDSVSSSGKYSQFLSPHHSRESSWRDVSPTSSKSASMQNLPDQPKLCQTWSKSTPHDIQVRKHMEQFAAINTKILSSPQRKLVHHNHAASAPDERLSQASRGKSMEEFGASPVTKPKALSKSSDQLDLRPSKYAPSGAEKRTEPIPTEDRLTQFPVKSLSCESSLTGDESTNITASLQPTPSEEIHDVPHSENHTDASTKCNTRPSSGDAGVKLEDSKQQDSFPQDENEMVVSSENILLDSSTTTDPSPLINNEEENTPQSSEEPVLTRPQNEQIPPPEEKTTSSVASLPEMMEVESKQIPALSEEPEMIFKKEKDLSAFGDVREGVGSLEKLHWDVLVQEVASADQSLVRALYPVSNRKTALMLMEQLLSEDSHLMEEHYKKKQEQSPESDEPPHGTEISVGEKAPITELFANCQSVLKAQRDDAHSPEMDVTKKKKQLIARLQHQLKHLHSIHSSLHTEEQVNGAKAEAMEALVREHCVPLELERYTLFITDLERVISLLLCLCARLARVQNSLCAADHESMDAEERESLDSRHRLLCKQRDDAKDLKENLNRRERQVSSFLQKRLTHTQLQEYSHLIQSKASLLIRLTDVQERQWLAEQQLQALIGSLPA